MRLNPAAAGAVLLGLAVTLAAALAAPPDPTYHSLRQAAVADAFVVENIVLRRDVGTLTLKSGVIGFTAPVNGRETLAVFSGEAEFTLTPATPIEKTYLKSLTEQDSLKEAFDRALFCFTDETGKEIRSQAKTKAPDARLADTLSDFRKRLRKQSADNIEATILADLYREKQPGFFSAYLHGRRRDDLQFHVKPRGAEPGLGPEEVMLYNVQPPGVPDEFLYHAHLQSEIQSGKASSDEDRRSVAAESYTIDTTIAKNDRFTATTKVQLRALEAGERVIPFSLLSTLRVSKVAMSGEEVAFIQEDKKEDSALYVVLPAPLPKDKVVVLEFEYAGDKVLSKEGGGNFAVGARESWYPNVNTFHDHAKFDLTFRVPRQYTLVSVGKLAKEWTDKDFACSRWVSEIPLAVAGFNYGLFKKKQITDQQMGITIEGYATSEAPAYLQELRNQGTGSMAPSALMEGTLADARNALAVFHNWFGKSEFDRIAITQQPQFSFGQSWPSLVYLPMVAYLDGVQRLKLFGNINNSMNAFVNEVTAHEVAHQYWGHMVGWKTYHDQWLSEGFADFSAGLYLQYTRKSQDEYLKYWEQARKAILDRNRYGRRANDAGPIWLGLRLNSEKNPAYSRVVYNKGGYVLHMLRQLMYDPKERDRPFIAMMQDFVKQHLNRNASTESFKSVVEKHMRSGMDAARTGNMDWFFNQWVYGTDIPKYKLDYTVAEEGGKVLLKGSISQSEVPADFVMMVPIYLDFDGQIMRMGTGRLLGATTLPLEVELPKKPKRVLLNYFHDILEQ